jgi:hypothetical protein
VYLANPHLYRRGMLFEAFLLKPEKTLTDYARPLMTISRAGLLQKQLDARRRADLDAALQEMGERAIRALAADSRCANGVWIEKLRHHTWRTERWANRKTMEASHGN